MSRTKIARGSRTKIAPGQSAVPLEVFSAKRTTLRAKAQNTLRIAILDGHFKAGQRLVERELCELTGASRSVLREALVHLEADGLIERQSYCGFRIVAINAHQICEIFELRASLETLAAELFTERASQSDIAAIAQTFGDLEDCVGNFDLQRMRAIKTRYYNLLFAGCGNVEIRRALGNVIDRIYYLRSQLMQDAVRRQASLEEMRRLTTALVNRDRHAARKASLAHLEGARAALLGRIADAEPPAAAKVARGGK